MKKIIVDEIYLKRINDCIKRIQQREELAVEELYDLFNTKLYFIGYSILRNKLDTEDFVQDFWAKIEIICDKWIIRVYGYRFLYKSAKNFALDRYKKIKRERERTYCFDVLDYIGCFDKNDRVVQNIETRDLLEKALNHLDEIERYILIENVYLEKSIREIAKQLHKSKTQVGRILLRAKEKIKSFFE